MFAERVPTIVVEAVKALFDNEYPDPKYRRLPVHVDFPVDKVKYPGIWVSFSPMGEVRNVGIGHVENVEVDTPEGPRVNQVYRWRFSGVIELTVHGLTSLERARMVDALTLAIGSGRAGLDTPKGDFRRHIEDNDLIGLSVIWESVTVGGFAEGNAPWGTDDYVYEGTVTLTCEGEFAFEPVEQRLVPLSAIVVQDLIDPLAPNTPPEQGWV